MGLTSTAIREKETAKSDRVRLAVLEDFERGDRCGEGSRGTPMLGDKVPDRDGGLEERADRNHTAKLVGCNGGEAHRCDAAAGLAIGIATELAGSDASGEVSRKGLRS